MTEAAWAQMLDLLQRMKPGVVISSEALQEEPRIEGDRVLAGAGYPVPRLVKRMAAAGLSGIEFAEGIPGSIGGCVRMNAGWPLRQFHQTTGFDLQREWTGEIGQLVARNWAQLDSDRFHPEPWVFPGDDGTERH